MATPNDDGQVLTNEQETDAMIDAAKAVLPPAPDIKDMAKEKAAETGKKALDSAKKNFSDAKNFVNKNKAEGKGALDGAGSALKDKAKGKANDAKNNVKNKGKDTIGKAKQAANNVKKMKDGDNPLGVANALMHKDTAAAKSRAKGAAVAAGKGAKNFAIAKGKQGLDGLANASYKQGDGTTGGDMMAGVQNVGIAAAKFAINGIKAAMGDPIAQAKFIAMATTLYIGLHLLLALVIGVLMANIISAAWNKMTEAFNAVTDAVFGTAYDNFTMEDQYEVLATAFGDEVLYAYEKLLEDVEDEVNNYANDPAYNEWNQVMKYNKTAGKVDFSILNTLMESYEGLEQGMPKDTVYIGGYTGDISDSEWGVNNVGSSTDTLSMTNPNYNKGMQKDGSTDYATGNESYFDAAEVMQSVKANLGYSAISDIAYLVSGYNVSMMESSILDMGEKVSNLELLTTVISYKVDIAARIFQNNADYQGFFGALGTSFSDALSKVFHGETSYFAYDKSQIVINETTQQRTVYEYTENIYYVQDEIFNYSVKYTCGGGCCSGHSDGAGGTTPCSSCHGHTTSYAYAVPHKDYIDACGATPPNITHDSYDDTAKSTWKTANPGKTVTEFTYSSSSNNGDAYPINRSTYNETQKSYTKYTLDIPMEAFDVDRILKALFETSPYYGDMTYYYTDSMDGVKIDETQDEVLEKYGRYIGKWKYPYKPETVTYKEGTDDEFTVLYCKSGDDPGSLSGDEEKEFYDNGIDSQPYMEQQMVWQYDCDCDPHYGTTSQCPNCGEYSVTKADEIPDAGISSQRGIAFLGIPLVYQNLYFSKKYGLDEDMMEYKQDTSKVMTTTDKIVIDDYTGEQIAGTYKVGDTERINVILEDDEGGIHYPITVMDRILSNKDTVLNVLENSQMLQAQLAKRGITYDERLTGGASAMITTPLAEYLMNLIIDAGSYGNLTVLGDRTYAGGIGSFQGEDLKKILEKAIQNNPDEYKQMCDKAGITGINFSDAYWNSTRHPDYLKYMSIMRKLLALEKNEQDEMFKDKLNEVMEFFRNNGITNRGALALLSTVGLYFEDISQAGKGGAATGSFREYVMMPTINCGDADALDVAYENLQKWMEKYPRFDSGVVRNKIDKVYNQLKIDIESGDVPWLNMGDLTPENLVPLIDMALFFTQSPYCNYFTYTQASGLRMCGADGAAALEQLYQTGTGHFYGDCSSFAASIYYVFGYVTPTWSGGWTNNSFGYQARTDWANILPGDVIQYDGHIEIFVGGDNGTSSVGFGSEPIKVHSTYMYRTPKAYYRVVE